MNSYTKDMRFVDLVGEALVTEFRVFPGLHLSRDAEHSISTGDVSNWVSRRSGSPPYAVYLGISDSALGSLAGVVGGDSHPDPVHHASRTISTLLQSALAQVARRIADFAGSPALEFDNGSGSPDSGLECLASYTLTWEEESGKIILVANKAFVSLCEQRGKSTEETLGAANETSSKPASNKLLFSVEMPVILSLGSTNVSFGEVLGFGGGSIVKLGCPIDAPVDIIVGGKTIARGTVVAVEGMYGVKVSEVLFDQTLTT